MFGAEVNVKFSARIELPGDLLETVWLGGGFDGLLGGVLGRLVATCEGEQPRESECREIAIK